MARFRYWRTPRPSAAGQVMVSTEKGDGVFATVEDIKTAVQGTAVHDAGNSGTSKTINLADGPVQAVTLTDDCVLTFTGGESGNYYEMLLFVTQDSTPRSITVTNGVQGEMGLPNIGDGAGEVTAIWFSTYDGWDTVRWSIVDIFAS